MDLSNLVPKFLKSNDKVEATTEANTVLLIENDRWQSDFFAGKIRELGYEILVAQDSEEGIQVAKENRDKIGLVLTDLHMGGEKKNGDFWLSENATDKELQIPTAILSGSISEDEVIELEKGIANDIPFISKDFFYNTKTTSESIQKTIDDIKKHDFRFEDEEYWSTNIIPKIQELKNDLANIPDISLIIEKTKTILNAIIQKFLKSDIDEMDTDRISEVIAILEELSTYKEEKEEKFNEHRTYSALHDGKNRLNQVASSCEDKKLAEHIMNASKYIEISSTIYKNKDGVEINNILKKNILYYSCIGHKVEPLAGMTDEYITKENSLELDNMIYDVLSHIPQEAETKIFMEESISIHISIYDFDISKIENMPNIKIDKNEDKTATIIIDIKSMIIQEHSKHPEILKDKSLFCIDYSDRFTTDVLQKYSKVCKSVDFEIMGDEKPNPENEYENSDLYEILNDYADTDILLVHTNKPVVSLVTAINSLKNNPNQKVLFIGGSNPFNKDGVKMAVIAEKLEEGIVDIENRSVFDGRIGYIPGTPAPVEIQEYIYNLENKS